MTDESPSATIQSSAEGEGERLVSTTRTDVFPLFYTELRLLAECAEGIDTNTEFLIANHVLTINTTTPAPADQILITASDPGRRPVNIVNLQVVASASMSQGSQPLELGTADGVFWSDAAVQKFLFPYIASCGGHEAAQMLRDVQSAWNFYPSDRVTVYALVHTIAQPGGPLMLGDIIQVAYTNAGSDVLQPLKTLRQFLVDYPPVAYENPLQPLVPYWRGGGLPADYQYPDYLTLRALAEHAASLDVQVLPQGWAYFMLAPAGAPSRFEGPVASLHESLPDGTIVVPVRNPTIPIGRPSLQGVWFTPDMPGPNPPTVNLCATSPERPWKWTADALFWSTGAVEKFLYPYYASTGGFDGLAELTDMAHCWSLNQPIDLGPEQPPVVIPTDGGGGTPQVFGLIHMPTSEWTEIETASQTTAGSRGAGRVSVKRDVSVLYGDAQGQVHVTRAGEFSAMNPPRRRG